MGNIILIQLYSFLVYLISGVIIGIFFDIFRILRKSFHTPDIITYMEDILFWLFTGVFLLIVLFKFGNGQLRIYNIIGILIGAFIYMMSISKLFIKINVIIIAFIKNIIYKLIKIILYPMKLILKMIRKIFKPFTFFVINIKKVISNCKKIITIKVKNTNKSKKIVTERRILEKNVEKYN